jgi:hypothetical protein
MGLTVTKVFTSKLYRIFIPYKERFFRKLFFEIREHDWVNGESVVKNKV